MIRSKVKSRLGKTLAAAALLVAMVATPLAASATTEGIGGSNEPYNQTLYYSKARYHSSSSATSFYFTSHSNMCASTFWIALRNQSTLDSTNKMNFTSVGGAQSFVWWNGSYTLPSAYYTVTARNDCAGNPGGTYNWGGSLTL